MRDRAFLKAEMHFRQAMNVIPAAYNLPHHYISAGNLASALIRQSEPRQSEVPESLNRSCAVNEWSRRIFWTPQHFLSLFSIPCVCVCAPQATSLFNVALQEMDRFDKEIPPLVSEAW